MAKDMSFSIPLDLGEPSTVDEEKEHESQLNTPRSSASDPQVDAAGVPSRVSSTSSLLSSVEQPSSLVSSLLLEPISNVIIKPSTAPQLRKLWKEIRSVQIKTLLYSTMVAVIASLSFGYGLGFSSPALNDLDHNKGKHTYFERNIYHDSFNAITAVGAMVGPLIAGWLVDYSGRQFTLVMCSVPFTLGWLFILLTDLITGVLFRPFLFIGRFIVGMGIGAASLVVPLYIAEISPENLRGLFGTMNQLAINFGVLLVQALGIGLDYIWLSAIGIGIMVVFVPLASWTLKESPRWLISQGKSATARQTLAWFRGPNFDIDAEQQEIEAQLANEEKLTFCESLRIICTWPVLHPLILSILLMYFQDFMGINAVIFNGEEIFDQVGVNNAAVVTTVTIGLVLCVGTFIGAFLTDTLGRKLLLNIGGALMFLGMGQLFIYDLLKNEPYCDPPDDPKCKDDLDPLAISGMMIYISGFSIGWGALPWLMTSELIPNRVRGTGVGIATCISWLWTVIVLASFGSYEDAVKPWGTFLTFGIISLLSIVFVAIFVPETKGKSLEEIERYFNRNHQQYIRL